MFILFCLVFFVHFSNCEPRIHFALKQNKEGVNMLRNYVLNECSNIHSKNYGKYLDIKTIQKMTQPSTGVIKLAMRFINKFLKINSNNCFVFGDSISCSVSMNHLANLYKMRTTINQHIPKSLFDFVEFPMKNMSKRLRFGKKYNHLKNNVVDSGFVTREVLLDFYNMPSEHGEKGFVNKTNVSAGAMEYQGQSGFSQTDMMKAQVASNVPSNNVTNDHIIGVNQNDPDGESELDMAVIWWSAANVDLWYEDWTGWMYSWAQDFLKRPRDKRPQVVSLSWGWNERDQCSITSCNSSKVYVERTDIEFMKIAAMGTTIVVASGDAGSPGRTNELCDSGNDNINPVFPGSSEWVLSVGATFVSNRNGTKNYNWTTPMCNHLTCVKGTTEEMTTFSQTGWTSGSGFSAWTATPKWQKNHVQKYLKSGVQLPDAKYFNRNGRAYPDVSAFGHNCGMYDEDEGGWTGEDGTSCSAPVIAGIITYLNNFQLSRGKPLLGFVNPLLYTIYEADPLSFHDIRFGNSSCTESACCGNQFGFVPQKGMWDVVSGLGTPDISRITTFLQKNI